MTHYYFQNLKQSLFKRKLKAAFMERNWSHRITEKKLDVVWCNAFVCC